MNRVLGVALLLGACAHVTVAPLGEGAPSTDFANLRGLTEIAKKATEVTLYERLPHQSFEHDLR